MAAATASSEESLISRSELGEICTGAVESNTFGEDKPTPVIDKVNGAGSEVKEAEEIAITKLEKVNIAEEDADDVPTNCDLVEENLFLGNLAAACDINLLKKHRIRHILTIDSCPLPTNIQHLPQVASKFLKVSDMPREDILQYFDETYSYIDTALKERKRVLVHCYYGVSRSATLVLAYLMKKYKITLEEAQTRLKQRRSVVGPNYGFLSQLKLYELMEFRIDKKNLYYKRFRLHVASDKMKAAKVLSTSYRDVIKPDPAPLQQSPEPVVYRCRKCRRILACASNIMPHTEGKSPIWFDFPKQVEEEMQEEGQEGINAEENGSICSEMSESTEAISPPPPSVVMKPPPKPLLPKEPHCKQMLFTEPLVWMTEVCQNLQGKLHCPNPQCKSKLGSFSWVMGCVCPCGSKVQPAFYLVPSKVDRSTSVLNVQITI